jgi:hypothetical protein
MAENGGDSRITIRNDRGDKENRQVIFLLKRSLSKM